MLKPAALAVALSRARIFLFGSECPLCNDGEIAHRWTRYDGTGSWRMHERGSVTFDTYKSKHCARNGWFTRHRLVTAMIVLAVGFFVIAGISAAWAADRPDKPSAWFCMQARMHRAQFATDKAAEDSALAQGASRADIAKAQRCRR